MVKLFSGSLQDVLRLVRAKFKTVSASILFLAWVLSRQQFAIDDLGHARLIMALTTDCLRLSLNVSFTFQLLFTLVTNHFFLTY